MWLELRRVLFRSIWDSNRSADQQPRAKMQKVSAKKIKILVADDHPVVRKGLQSCLAKQDRLRIVGEASDGDEALQKTRELSPDVVLMDISMPGMNGLAVTEGLRKETPTVKVLVLSVHDHRDYTFRLIQAGGRRLYFQRGAPGRIAARH